MCENVYNTIVLYSSGCFSSMATSFIAVAAISREPCEKWMARAAIGHIVVSYKLFFGATSYFSVFWSLEYVQFNWLMLCFVCGGWKYSRSFSSAAIEPMEKQWQHCKRRYNNYTKIFVVVLFTIVISLAILCSMIIAFSFVPPKKFPHKNNFSFLCLQSFFYFIHMQKYATGSLLLKQNYETNDLNSKWIGTERSQINYLPILFYTGHIK